MNRIVAHIETAIVVLRFVLRLKRFPLHGGFARKDLATSGIRIYTLIIAFLCVPLMLTAQESGSSRLTGVVRDQNGQSIPYAHIRIDSLHLATAANNAGAFTLSGLSEGTHWLVASALGYREFRQRILVASGEAVNLAVVLEEDSKQLDEVVVEGQTIAGEKRSEAYAVEVIDTRKLQSRDVSINQLTSQMAGVRVRESGGLGSSFSYSLNGMSGRSVRFFIDGVPMDRYGSAYSINNFPVTLIDRIEIYKGVVPPQMGSDALGGVVNLVSKSSFHKYLDASYSYGSFNTHRAALSTRWVHQPVGLYVDLQAYYNYADNNYKVWGPGVEVADPATGRAVPVKTRRFHDRYSSVSGKLDVGLTEKKWADQVKLSFQYAHNDNELQHGATMAAVIGEATQATTSYAPALQYSKKDLLVRGFDLAAFSSVSWLKTHLRDTSSRIYNWLAQVIDERPNNSEMGGGANGKSLLTLEYVNQFHQANATYNLSERQKVILGYTYDGTVRTGNDPMISNRTASFREPQELVKQIIALSYEAKFFGEKLVPTGWLKYYDFRVSTVGERYITDSLGYRPEAFPITNTSGSLGYGAAVKYSIGQFTITKLSIEKSYRLPDALEILGDGLFVRTSPNLNPEESMNVNIGALVSRIPVGAHGRLSIEPSLFYRNTYNLILYQVQSNLGSGTYGNIGKVRGAGGSMDVRYENDWIQGYGNITYQDLRDWNEYNGPNRNLTYKDQLPNTPYLMSNGGVTLTKRNFLRKGETLSFFWDVQYVHQFFLRWPSLGDPSSKANIPTQFVNNTGITWALRNGMYNVSFACNNMFDEQVYDNYLLQKPGRAFSIKIRVYVQ